MLEAIKITFGQRLSPAFGKKRYSQPTIVVNSQESLARRAELKRLMHKRIRDELRSEGESNGAALPTDNHREKSQANPSLSKLPGDGLRDTVEFSAEEMNEIRSNGLKCNTSENLPLTTTADDDQLSDLNQNNNNSASTRNSRETTATEGHTKVVACGSPSNVHESPELSPVHVPSLRSSSSTHSWHLEYSAEQLTTILRIHEESQKQASDSKNLAANTVEVSDSNNAIKDDGAASHEPSPSASLSGHSDCLNASGSAHEVERCFISDTEEEQVYVATLHEGSLEIWLRSQDMPSGLNTSEGSEAMTLSKIPESDTQEVERMDGDGQQELGSSSKESKNHRDEVADRSLTEAQPQSLESCVGIEELSPELVAQELSIVSVKRQYHEHTPEQALTIKIPEGPSSHCTPSRYTTRSDSTQRSRKSPRLNVVELFGNSRSSPGSRKASIQCKYQVTSLLYPKPLTNVC